MKYFNKEKKVTIEIGSGFYQQLRESVTNHPVIKDTALYEAFEKELPLFIEAFKNNKEYTFSNDMMLSLALLTMLVFNIDILGEKQGTIITEPDDDTGSNTKTDTEA